MISISLHRFYRIILFIFSLLAIPTIAAQKVDRVNAPSNPIGFKYHKDHYGLKGAIYSSGEKIFDIDGKVIMSYDTKYYYENGKLVSNNYGDTYRTDSAGNVTEKSFNGKTTYYQFNQKGLLTREENIYDEINTHTYDSKDRIKKSVVLKKGELFQERDYSYRDTKEGLEVTITYTSLGANSFDVIYIYKDGYLVKEQLSSGTYEYIVVTDAKGNKIKFYDKNKQDAKHFETVNRYYDEKDRNPKMEFGFYKSSPAALSKGAMYHDGKRLTDIDWVKGIRPDELVAYDGLKNAYYSATTTGIDKEDVSTRLPVKIISQGMPSISYSYDGNFIVYIKGRSSIKKRDFSFLGPHLLDYRIEITVPRTYMINNYRNIEDEVKRVELISTEENNVFYMRELEKDNFFIVHNGNHIDYKKATFKYLNNGDPVILIDDVPLYVLTGFKTAQNNEIKQGKFYTNELELEISKENPKTTTAPSTADFDCVKGDCKEGWGRVSVNGIITDATFKDGAINGLAYISYPNGSYFHGEYDDNRRNGVGYYKWDNGNVYIGQWQDGKQHGYGYTMNSKNQITSAGKFENGKLVVKMSTAYRENAVNGNCTGNCKDGFGKFSYSNGDIYWGFFSNNQRAHVGTYLWNNKSTYTGAYTEKGSRNGYGIYTYVDKSVFKGYFVNDRITGLGVMKYNKSGDLVQGVFDNNGAKLRDF